MNALCVMHAFLVLFPAERGERVAHCTAQNKPKRFKQPYFSATTTRTRATTFFFTCEERTRVNWGTGKATERANA